VTSARRCIAVHPSLRAERSGLGRGGPVRAEAERARSRKRTTRVSSGVGACHPPRWDAPT